MHVFDLLLRVDRAGYIFSLEWRNEDLRLQHLDWRILRGCSLQAALKISLKDESGTFTWNDEEFAFELLQGEKERYYFIRKADHENAMLKLALDDMADGIQIYDSSARLVYLNDASRRVSNFPRERGVEGKRLHDLYPNVDIDYSTTMTTLRTQQPVHFRLGDYATVDGRRIITLNSGYPLFDDGKLLGVVIHEHNIDIIQDKIQRLEEQKAAIASQLSSAFTHQRSQYSFSNVIGQSQAMRHAVELAQRVSLRAGNVLLVGETGTGKEIFAQSIHNASPRRDEKFVSINCAAVPENLIESILFGTTRGAFTGATDKPGLFEEACNGTLFLDELNSMSLAMQAKILRVLQEGVFRRVGGSKDIQTNARIVSACNEEPYRLMEDGKLRRDLFYRVGAILIPIPPLRRHKEDIEELAYYRLRALSDQSPLAAHVIAPETLAIMREYDWPGNVRELNHAIDYAVNLCGDDILLPEHLPPHLLKEEEQAVSAPIVLRREQELPQSDGPGDLFGDIPNGPLQDVMEDYENRVVRAALHRCGGNVSWAAAMLGIKRQSLQYRIRKYGIII